MKKIIGVIILIALLVVASFFYLKYKGKDSSKTTYVAIIDKEGIAVQDYQKKLEETKNFFNYTKQDTSTMSSLEKDILEKMIDESLIRSYAKGHGITVTDREVESRYVNVVEGYNRNNNVADSGDSQFLEKIKTLYGTNKDDYWKQLKAEILREKVQASIKIPLTKWLKEEKQKAEIKRFL